MYAGDLIIDLDRPPAFSDLLSVLSTIYTEAYYVLFTAQPFWTHFEDDDLPPANAKARAERSRNVYSRLQRRTVPHNESGKFVLRLPTQSHVSTTLDGMLGLTTQLVRLGSVIAARKEKKFESVVSLSLAKVQRAKKKAVVKSFRGCLGEQEASVRLRDVGDV